MNLKYYLRGLGLGIVMAAIVLGITASGKKAALTEEEIVARAKDLGMVEEEELEKQLEDARAETEQRVKEEAMAEYSAFREENSSMEAGDSGPDAQDGEAGEGLQGTEDGQAEESGQEEMPENEAGSGRNEAAGNAREDGEGQNETREQGSADEESREQDAQGNEGGSREPGTDREAESEGMTERGMAEGEKETVFIVKKGESPYSIGKRMEEEGLLPKDAGFDRYLVDHGFDTKVVAAEYAIPADADMETIAKIITKQISPN